MALDPTASANHVTLPGEGATPLLAVVRDGELIRFDDERGSELRAGDRVVELRGALTHTRG